MGERLLSLLDRRWAWLVVAALAFLFVLVNPAGYAGGGNDDARYLDAALCWAREGAMCLPQTHWATRWPGIATLAAAVGAFGETRFAVALGSLPWWIASIALAGWCGSLWFGRRAGLLCAALLASVPIVANQAFRPNADLPELAAQLAALALATLATRRKSRGFALAAGFAAGVAVAARDTSLLFVPIAALTWWLWAPKSRGLIAWAAAGLAALLLGEMAIYALAAGDPLRRFHLAMAHGRIPSQYLQPWVDTRQSPIFNPDFISGWKRPLGIRLWWPLDPWLNLLLHPQIGAWLAGGVLGGWLVREHSTLPERRRLLGLLVGGVGLMVGLIYVLAIDPRPRMFLLVATGASLAIAFATVRQVERGGGTLMLVLVAALMFLGALTARNQENGRALEDAARRWIQRYPGQIEVDQQTHDTLALVAEARTLPVGKTGRPMRMTLQLEPCPEVLARSKNRERIELLDSRQLASGSGLCLLRYTNR